MLFLVACSDYEINGEAEKAGTFDEGGAPDITIDPPALDFGVVDPASGVTEPQVVTVTNVGDADLLLRSAAVSDGSAFTVEALDGTTVAPGGTSAWAIRYDPAIGTATDLFIVGSNDPDEPEVDVSLAAGVLLPDITVDPLAWDFGTLEPATSASVTVNIQNDGDAALTIDWMTYTTFSPGELTVRELPTGTITLGPGEATTVDVDYTPTDGEPDEGYLTVHSDDPDEREVIATQVGNARPFEGFSTGWYIVEDDTAFETTSNPSYVVDSHGDPDGYWYEPSGVNALIDSSDPEADFEVLHDYVVARAGEPTPVTGPLSFRASSTIPCQSYASFNYILADFWIEADDDPNLYQLTTGTVDDGIKVMVNAETVGHVLLGATGSWNLGSYLTPGEVNTLVVILMDDCAVDKYIYDLTFVRDGVVVEG